MLRSRLYIGMLPVAGLLISICLYSIYNYNILAQQLKELQTEHYAEISKIDQILLATSQAERAIRLHSSDDKELSERIRQRSHLVLRNWLDESENSQGGSASNAEVSFTSLLEELDSLIKEPFSSRTAISDEKLRSLLERIEDEAVESIASHSSKIIDINMRFQKQSRTHFFVVLGGIVASVILMGWVAYFLSQRILRPVEALTLAAGKLADNNWETDYTPTQSDEIGKLEIAFLEMTRRLRDYKEMTSRQIVRTRQRMEECFSNLPHPVIFINADRSLAYRNPRASSLIDKLNYHDGVLHPTLNKLVDSVFGTGEDVLSTDFDDTITFNFDNEEHHYLPIVVRIDGEEVEDIECALILQDVTNLRLSDELKSDLVATVSHEIKTPVTSATMALHLLHEGSLGKLNSDQHEMINTAISDLKRLQRLLDHMLQIARIEQRVPKLNTQPYPPYRIIEAVIESHAYLAKTKQVVLNAQIESNLPDVHVDPSMMEVALSNLISNALKHGGSNSTLTIYADSSRFGYVRFGVLDEGPGVPKEDLNKVFDKFYRSAKGLAVEGVGLGLSTCKDIISAHGGEIHCSNRPVKGADFYFYLPVKSETIKSAAT